MRYIETLRLTDFRSYDQLDLVLDQRPVVLFGANGAGKTNLLEAVSFLSPGRGLRRAKLEDIARRVTGPSGVGVSDIRASGISHSAPAWGVAARLQTLSQADDDLNPEAYEPIKIAVGQVPEFPKRRVMRVNDQNAKGPELAALMNLIWLTPAQDRLFTGPASDRRKFLDRFTLAHKPDHGTISNRYEKARAERNRLLSDGVDDPAWYSALEQDLALHGAEIAQARVKTVALLSSEIERRPDGAFPKAILNLQGRYEAQLIDGLPEGQLSELIKSHLRSERDQDMRAGRTLHGVHRSDLSVIYRDKNMPASDCSTGEQKALLIGLTLAHCRALRSRAPFLLLDEVAAHLDIGRRAALTEDCLELGTQVFMTGTDQNLFEAFGARAQMFNISDGILTPCPKF